MKLSTCLILMVVNTILALETLARRPAPCDNYHVSKCSYKDLLAHPLDCNKFLQCSNGHEFIHECQTDLVFNVEKQICDYIENVPNCWDE